MTRNNYFKFSLALFIGLALVAGFLTGCGGPSDEPLSVDSLAVSSAKKIENTTDTDKPPVYYEVTVSWSLASIREDEKASAAITALDVTLRDGSATVEEKELSTTATSHTFSVCEPGVSYWASVRAVYTQDAYEDLSGSSTEVRVLYGPWASDSVTLGGTRKTESLSVGSFNHQDGLPSGQFSLSDFYYYNPYNPDYLFAAENDETWIVVDVYERTDTNEEDRNNVNYLTENVELLDSNTPDLTSYDDMADVDLEFYDIYNNKIFELTGTNTSGTISSSDYSSLIDSVNSGYYEDKDGVFFIRAICKSMPSTFSDSNSEDQLGYWGLAIYGASKNYE